MGEQAGLVCAPLLHDFLLFEVEELSELGSGGVGGGVAFVLGDVVEKEVEFEVAIVLGLVGGKCGFFGVEAI